MKGDQSVRPFEFGSFQTTTVLVMSNAGFGIAVFGRGRRGVKPGSSVILNRGSTVKMGSSFSS